MPSAKVSFLSPNPTMVDGHKSPLTDTTDRTIESVLEESTRSHDTALSGGSSSAKSPDLRGNLTRQHRNRDPFTVYDTVRMLGEGSMGSVSLVRKKNIGGSARYNAQARAAVEEKYQNCFALPLIGGLMRWILQHKAAADMERAAWEPVAAPAGDISGSTTITSSFSLDTSSSQLIYAMKSIHYNLIKDQIFVDELRNEIAVLKTLDHAHIVRVLDTYDFDKRMFVVMEVCSGGDLYTRDPYTEEEAARIVTAVLRAVAYMHHRGVIHRDVSAVLCLGLDR